MRRFAIPALAVFVWIVSLSCQTYTTGLQQAPGRVDETAAIATLRTIGVAQRSYSLSNGGDYGTFQQLCEADYLDSRFNSDHPAIKDYVLTMKVFSKSEGPSNFGCNADPSGNGAGRHFYIDQSTVLHVNASQPATAADPPIQP
jgi:hypothetical protein